MSTHGASATTIKPLRIGELAELTGTTPRTIRYWEEMGLLPSGGDREQGKHRLYDEADVERVNEIVRLRDLLGLSLEQLSRLLEAEDARANLRREWAGADDPTDQRRILTQSLGHITDQLELVRSRRADIARLERDLVERRQRVAARLAELDGA